jgi:hypothetical protein
MPKRSTTTTRTSAMMMKKARANADTESLLAELVRRIDPGELRLMIPRWAAIRERSAFELNATTRDCTIVWDGKTIAEAAREGLEYLDTPEPDPFQPPWSRCTRMQRQVVRSVLLEHAARHRATAASAKVAATPGAGAAFALADAFFAAIEELDHQDVDDRGELIVEEPLAGEPAGGADLRPGGR